MTIGFLINTSEPFYRGGYERRAWAFARELARQGHTVRIYTSCPRREIREGVEFIPLAPLRSYFNARGVRNGWADLLFIFSLIPLFWRWRRRELEILDVCATPFLHLPLVALLCWWKGIPVVLTCHEALLAGLPAYAVERGFPPGPVSRFVAFLLGLTYRFGTSLFSHRVAVSQTTARALGKESFPAEATIEFGLEPEAFSPQPPVAPAATQPVQFISCGRLTPIKNVRLSIEALVSLQGKFPFRFHILGEGSERPVLEALAAAAPDQIIFHGEVPESRKRELLARSEIFLLSSAREGFAIAALEGMACGCGVLLANDSRQPNGALDFVQPGVQGLAAPPEMAAWRAALLRLDQNPAERLQLRRSAWEKAQEYRVETQARRLADFYQTLLSTL